jgi:acetylornithine aminotransferase
MNVTVSIGGILIAPHFKASYGLLGTTLAEVIWLAQHCCFRYYRKSELDGECGNVEAYFMEAIKVIPEIIKAKGRIDARC